MKESVLLDAKRELAERPKVNPEMHLSKAKNAADIEDLIPVFHRQLFAASLVELAAPDRSRRRWATMVSFIFQGLVIGFLILLPLMLTEDLPMERLATYLTAPPPPPAPPPAPAVPARVHAVSEVFNGQLRMPRRIPAIVQMIKEEEVSSSLGGVEGGVVGGVPGGQIGGVLSGLIGASHNVPAALPQPPPVLKRVKISEGVSEGMLIRKIDPPYPVLAERAHVQGSVQLRAIISKEGTIENLQVVSGHPLLVPATLEAVQRWQYRPYRLSGEPVEVETVINVNFHLH